MSWLAAIVDDIDRHGAVVRVTVVRADGSTPRELGAAMSVSGDGVHGTIGGGALEHAAIAHAHTLRAVAREAAAMGSPSLVWGGVRGGGNLDAGVLPSPPPCPSPTRGEGTARLAPNLSRPEQPVSRFAAQSDSKLQWGRDLRDFPLGPSLGQCCGGYVRLLFEVLTAAERDHLMDLAQLCGGQQALLVRPLDGGLPLCVAADRKEHRPQWPLAVTRAVREMLSGARPRGSLLVRGAKGQPAWFIEPVGRPMHRLYLYGAGHVGRAVVRVLEGLPFAVTWVDTLPSRFPGRVPAHATPSLAADPAAFAGAAEGGAFHIVLTYSHALDLAICHSLLRRDDFRFLGLIGSATKRARFLKRLSELGIGQAQLARLVCPIGLPGLAGKEPAVIALSVAAQLVQLAAAADATAPGPTRRTQDAAR